MGAIHSTTIPTGPFGKSGSPKTVNQFFRNFSGWTEPKFPENRAIHHLAILYTWQGISWGGIPLDLRAGDFRSLRLGRRRRQKRRLKRVFPFFQTSSWLFHIQVQGKRKNISQSLAYVSPPQNVKKVSTSCQAIIQLSKYFACIPAWDALLTAYLRFFGYLRCYASLLKVLHRRPKLTLRGKGVM